VSLKYREWGYGEPCEVCGSPAIKFYFDRPLCSSIWCQHEVDLELADTDNNEKENE
jgi:hypothetical protein